MKNSKKTIIFLDLDDIKNPLLGAGQSVVTMELGRRLANLNYSVIVISSKYPGYRNRFENGIEYRHIGINTGNIHINNALYILTVPFYVRRLHADVIIECFTAPISTLFTPLWTKIPVVAIPTSFEAKRFSDKYHLPLYLIERFGVKFYKYFLAFSDYANKKMKKLNPEVISEIIPPGVDNSYFTIRRRTPKHILFLGRFDIGQKGIDLLLKAYLLISKKTKYPLVLAGFGPDENTVKNMIGKLGLTGRVILSGPTYGNNKTKLMSQAVCAVVPSRDETFSCFALEALAGGIPLITFDIPGLRWITSGSTLKASAFSPQSLAENILKATEPSNNTIMSKLAREYAASFTWDNTARRYDHFIRRVVLTELNKK
jgi:glycogen(starch) synthase